MAIDVGNEAIIRDNYYAGNYTYVTKGNPANAIGIIDTVEIWAHTEILNTEVALFYVVSGDNLSTRGNETIGTVAQGSKQTFSNLSMAVSTGDYIGLKMSASGAIRANTASGGKWYESGDYIPCTNQLFISSTDRGTGSIYGTGVEISYLLAGVTKDKDGNVKATSECFLCKDNLDNTASFIAYTQSDGSGNYSFTGLADADYAQYFVISWKDETPHIFDVTDHILQPVEE